MQRWLRLRHLSSICGRMAGRLDDDGRRMAVQLRRLAPPAQRRRRTALQWRWSAPHAEEQAAVRDRTTPTGRPETCRDAALSSAWPDDWMTAAGAAVAVVVGGDGNGGGVRWRTSGAVTF
jgi:hypothetical protein